MKRAASYLRVNQMQRRDAKQLINEFAPLLRWRPDGRDSLLDVGCGVGDVTIDYVLPLLPENYSRLVGVDVSDPMLHLARERYGHMKVSFDKVDIGDDLRKYFTDGWKPVDHITSFYCLHWVRNQKRAIKNIYNLLAPNGDCLLIFIAASKFYDVYMQMSKFPKWAPYMADVNHAISPYHYSEDAADEFETILKRSGFKDYHVVVRDLSYVYKGVDVLKSSYFDFCG